MKASKVIFVSTIVMLMVACGGDDKTITNNSNDTSADPSKILAILEVQNSAPANGDGPIKVTSVKSDVNLSGGDQLLRIIGNNGSVKHQIDVHYTIYFSGGSTYAYISEIIHAWGTDLQNSLDGGISICSWSCADTEITPTYKTIVFKNQILDEVSNLSTLVGTVIYP